MKVDFSKGVALHRLYGHYVFTVEAKKAKKDMRFVRTICSHLKCTGQHSTWRDQVKV